MPASPSAPTTAYGAGRTRAGRPVRHFWQAVKAAEGEAEVRAVAIIQKQMPGDWRAAMSYLERKHRRSAAGAPPTGRRSTTAPAGGGTSPLSRTATSTSAAAAAAAAARLAAQAAARISLRPRPCGGLKV